MPLSRQQIFDNALNGIRAQQYEPSGVATADDGMKCLYRGPRNLKCAIGHSIPDEAYSPSFEQAALDVIIEDHPELFAEKDRHFLCSLQSAHDEILGDHHDPSSWEEKMSHIAYDFKLHFTPKEILR